MNRRCASQGHNELTLPATNRFTDIQMRNKKKRFTLLHNSANFALQPQPDTVLCNGTLFAHNEIILFEVESTDEE